MLDQGLSPLDAKIAFVLHYVVFFSAYAVLWFLCLFCLLPLAMGAERDPETGAPLSPQLGRKALWAVLIAAVLWGVFYLFVHLGWLEV